LELNEHHAAFAGKELARAFSPQPSPLPFSWGKAPGLAPGWYDAAPLALLNAGALAVSAAAGNKVLTHF
jgi:hypothetical protein